MILLLLRPGFYRALFRDVRNAIALAVVGPICRVTGDRVAPEYRVLHERDEHPADGPCVRL